MESSAGPPWAAGNAAFKAGKLKEALEHYTSYLQKDTGDDSGRCTVLSNRAQVYLQLKEPALALKDAKAALATDPMLAKAIYRKVVALGQLGRCREADIAAKAVQHIDISAEDKRRIMAAATQASKKHNSDGAASKRRILLDATETSSGRLTPEKSWLPDPLQDDAIVFVSPPDGQQPENILVMLHGLGDVPGNYAKLARKMGLPGTMCIVLSAPLKLPFPGMEGGIWFHPRGFADNDKDEIILERESYVPTCDLIGAMLHILHDKGRWPYSRLHLFGFSQGGSVALGLAVQFSDEQKLGGCISVSGHLLLDYQGPPPVSGSTGGTPVLITHGDKDDQVSKQQIDASVAKLKSYGCPVRCRRIPNKGHSMVNSELEMRALMEFWAETLKAPAPVAAAGERIVEVQKG